jgi:hypothetical protein
MTIIIAERDLDNIWINAWARYLDGDPDPDHDTRPSLKMLLESKVPMTPGAQETLKNLLFPHDPPSDAWILTLKRNPKFDRMLKEIDVVHEYTKKRAEGAPPEAAAKAVCRSKNVTAGQLRRYRARARELGRYLRGQ